MSVALESKSYSARCQVHCFSCDTTGVNMDEGGCLSESLFKRFLLSCEKNVQVWDAGLYVR